MRILKLFLVFLILIVSAASSICSAFDRGLCSVNGVKLYGKVRVVTDSPDVRVRLVHDGADLTVRLENTSSLRCGSWQLVDSGEELSVMFDAEYPDLSIAVR